MIGNCSPTALRPSKGTEDLVPSLQIGEPILRFQQATVVDITPPFSSFHYHINSVRLSPPHPVELDVHLDP
jgi:betaine lipid synthase